MINKSVIFIFLFINLTLFTACGIVETPQKQNLKKLPLWITTPKHDTNKYMYGISINRDRQTAINNALINMISKLGINIESTFQSNQKVYKYYEKSVSTNSIKAEVAKIKINNYEVVKSQRLSYKEFAVMIKTDKKKFINGLVQELKSKRESIKSKQSSLENEDILTRYNVKKELFVEADLMNPNIIVLSELDKNYDIKKDFSFIHKIKQDFVNEQKKLSFYVYGDKKSSSFVNEIKNYLTKNGFRLGSTKTKNSVLVKLNTRQNIQKNSYMKIAVLQLNLNVYDKKQKIGGRSIVLKERYKADMSNVYKNASIHFQQDIESLSISEVLGVNLK